MIGDETSIPSSVFVVLCLLKHYLCGFKRKLHTGIRGHDKILLGKLLVLHFGTTKEMKKF
jgi:hypothetical protein